MKLTRNAENIQKVLYIFPSRYKLYTLSSLNRRSEGLNSLCKTNNTTAATAIFPLFRSSNFQRILKYGVPLIVNIYLINGHSSLQFGIWTAFPSAGWYNPHFEAMERAVLKSGRAKNWIRFLAVCLCRKFYRANYIDRDRSLKYHVSANHLAV